MNKKMNKKGERKTILIIKSVMLYPRYHFDRTMELSKYFDIIWIVNHEKYGAILDDFKSKNHKIIEVGKKPSKKNKIISLLTLIHFYIKIYPIIKRYNSKLIIVHMDKLCFLLPLMFPRLNFALIMGTGAVSNSSINNFFTNLNKKFISAFFKNIITGTDWMIDKFNLQKKNVIIPKWGTKSISKKEKEFNNLSLLYIGTLTNRRIHETIEGLGVFISNNNLSIDITYDIIGTGSSESLKLIRESIKQNCLDKIVHLHGYLSDKDILQFFDHCNIGVAYVPITEYYTNVVATKINEYILSGMVSIATKTNENIKVVTSENGVLIDDTPTSFAKGLEMIYDNLTDYSSEIIFNQCKKQSLEYGVKNHIVPDFLKLISND